MTIGRAGNREDFQNIKGKIIFYSPGMARKTGKRTPVTKEPGFPDDHGINEALADFRR
jgi:hypothetical protein